MERVRAYKIAGGGSNGGESDNFYDGVVVQHAIPPVYGGCGVQFDQKRAEYTL